MKKVILFAAILFAGVSVVKAQEVTNAEVKLNVILSNIQSIVVSNQSEVTLEYKTLDNYYNGVSSEVITDHLTVSSSGGFEVNVKAADLTTTGETTTSKIIAASTIDILAVKGTNGLEGVYKNKFPLSNNDQAFLTSTKGGIKKPISITYYGAGGDKYVENFTGGADGVSATYTTTVTYTIYPQ